MVTKPPNVAQQFNVTNLAGVNTTKLVGKKRFPFLFLVDVSGSTGAPPDPDINHINAALNKLLETLKVPPSGSELEKQVDHIDLAIVAYSDHPQMIQKFEPVMLLPPSIAPLTPLSNTNTARAFTFALDAIADQLRDYRTKKDAWGKPHIFHLTDGAMNDAKPGDALWNDIKTRLDNVTGSNAANETKQKVGIYNFVSPKGTRGAAVGMQLMKALCGDHTLHELGAGAEAFEKLVTFTTGVMTRITQNYGTGQAGDIAAKEAGIPPPKGLAPTEIS